MTLQAKNPDGDMSPDALNTPLRRGPSHLINEHSKD
jgi:hypothetical protein